MKFSLADKLAARNPQKALARARELQEKGEHQRAFELFVVAAEAGETVAEREVGLYCLNGLANNLRSATEAARWITRAAEKGDVKAQSLLGGMFAHGFRAEAASSLFTEVLAEQTDLDSALLWSEKAAIGGDADAMALTAYIYFTAPPPLRDLDKARHYYELAAAAGQAQGHLGIGILTIGSAATDEATFAAVDHIRKAAEADLPNGHYYMALIYEQAVGVLPDVGKAAFHYGEAAKGGVRNAQAKYGYMLFHGMGVRQNKVEGETWLRRAGLAGDAEAASVVADIYARGDSGLPPNYAEAAVWFRLAAEAGHKQAARSLGLLHLTGAGSGAVVRDADEAAKWFRLAAEQGDKAAQTDLATLQMQGLVDPRFTEAAPVHDWFEQAAESGDPVGAYNFAVCLAEGVGVARDEALAAAWFLRAAETLVNAQHRYGRLLAEGRGVQQDFVQARAWLKKAADLNVPEALLDLAALLLQGLGGPRDDAEAARLFEAAAAQGYAEAMFALGAIYGGGHEVPTDRAKSLAWYRQAAAQGHARSALMLGKYLKLGIATPQDLEQARHWFTVAAGAGLEEARSELAGLQPPASAAE